MNKFLISIVGPTAIGKTSLSIQLAQHFKTEILSADSRQFFREMYIGTAVPSAEELAAVPHHFIRNRSIEEKYSVGDFEREALSKLKALFNMHEKVVMVGGSGLYVKAVTDGLDRFPNVDSAIRKSLNTRLEEEGISFLREQLKAHDPAYYAEVDLNNPHRLIRALEVSLGTGTPYSSFKKKSEKAERPFNTISIGLTAEREIIYKRINRRVDLMVQNGLIEEAKELFPRRDLNALNTVGYKELFSHFEGNCSLEEAILEIKKNTRRFAKRQLTWFRKDPGITWFDYTTSPQEVIQHIEEKANSASTDL